MYVVNNFCCEQRAKQKRQVYQDTKFNMVKQILWLYSGAMQNQIPLVNDIDHNHSHKYKLSLIPNIPKVFHSNKL